MSKFKEDHSFEERKKESEKMRKKYPDRIPCIVEKSEKSDIADIDKVRFLVPSELNIGQFVYVIRKRIELNSDKAIYIFINGTLPPTAAQMSLIYDEHKDEDGFLYVKYAGENGFGIPNFLF